MTEVKYFAIDASNQDLVKALERCESSTYEMDAELFEKRNEGFTRNGLASTFLIGNLVEDPQPMIDPLTKYNRSKPTDGNVDYIEDRDYVYMATFCYETDVFWDHKTNKRHANNNYIRLAFMSKGAKYAISHYRKGDGLIVSGFLRSIREGNPEDARMQVNVQYLVVTDFSANPGTHLRREINAKFKKNTNTQKKYSSIQEVLADRSLTVEQQNDLIAKITRSQYEQKSSSNNSTSSTQEPTVQSTNQELDGLDSVVPPKLDNINNYDISDNELNNAFNLEF